MQRNYFLIIFFVASMDACATLSSQCGSYQIVGTVKEKNKSYEIIFFKDSLSEGHLDILDRNKIWGFKDKKIRVTAQIEEPLKYNRGKIKIESIEEVMPDFRADYEGDAFNLIKAAKCKYK